MRATDEAIMQHLDSETSLGFRAEGRRRTAARAANANGQAQDNFPGKKN